MNPATGLLLWIVIGTIAGWLASNVTGSAFRQGPYRDVLSGLAGALCGGYLTRALFGSDAGRLEFFASLGAAVLGACAVIAITKLLFVSRRY